MDRSFTYVREGESIGAEMPLRDALLMPPGARRTVKASGVVTKEGNVRMADGSILPLPGTYRFRRPRE
jgi:hypothetical protein